MAINETHLISTDTFQINGYRTIRADSPEQRRKHGVALLIKKNVAFSQVHLPALNFNAIGIKIHNTTLIFTYIPPQIPFPKNDLVKLFGKDRSLMIIGDLNCRHTDWNNSTNNTNGNKLRDLCDSHNIAINFPDGFTRFDNIHPPSTLDIILSKNTNFFLDVVVDVALDSDHYPITTTIPTSKTTPRTNIIQYNKINWNSFKKIIQNKIQIPNILSTTQDIDDTITNLSNLIKTTLHQLGRRTNTHKSHPTLSKKILELIKERNRVRKVAQRTAQPEFISKYIELKNKARDAIATEKNNNWLKLLRNLDTRDNSLWRACARLKPKNNEIPPLVNENGECAVTDEQKASSLAQSFNKAHALPTQKNRTLKRVAESSLCQAINNSAITFPAKDLATLTEIKNLIKTLKNKKAPGKDKIPNIAIKNLPGIAIAHIKNIINACLKLCYFPDSWKLSIVIPIHKSNKNKSSPSSYRPISLLSSLSKILEKILLTRTNEYLESLDILPHFQYGFRKGRSTTGQLARLVSDIKTGFGHRKTTVTALFDVEKAFDRVWHAGLIWKMGRLGFPSHLIKIIAHYLANRSYRVSIDGSLSRRMPIPAGVPQGSVLGPVLYNIYISDIPLLDGVEIAQFADDTAVYSTQKTAQEAVNKIQAYAKILVHWCDTWLITLNKGKTELAVFSKAYTRALITNPLQIDNETIPSQTSIKYLGIILDKRLTFKKQILSAKAMATAAIAKIYPLINNHSTLPIQTKTLLYKSFVRPILTYAAPVIGAAARSHIQNLQITQNNVLRTITNKHFDGHSHTSIQTLHKIANIETIQEFISKLTNNFLIRSTLYHNQPD